MLTFKTLYTVSFVIVLSLAFLVGGFFQYFFGLSNTGLMFFLALVMFLTYIIYVYVKKKVIINRVIILFALYVFVMIVSSFVNQTDLFSTLIYINFAFLPLSVYYFLRINKIEGYIQASLFYKFLFFIASIQLPILLLQRNFYNPLISLNNSGQYIASYDFMFGSFLVKSDHSLGCFLLFFVVALIFNFNKVNRIIKFRFLLAIYLSISVLLTESNISKALLVSAWLIYIVQLIYSNIPRSFFNKKFYIITSAILFVLLAYNVRNIGFITSRLGGTIEQNYTLEKSEYFYKEKTAKRIQIIIVAINSLDVKYIGDGPYSYFDIRTGKFSNTYHFSQVLWSYFDLGLIGLGIAFLYMFGLISSFLADSKYMVFFIFPVSLIYLMYTTVFTEIGILLSLFLFFSLKPNDEFNNNTLSRLEEK